MKTKPILFSTPMIQALLDGRKTMTRRIVKPESINEAIEWCGGGCDEEPATIDTFQLHWGVSHDDGKAVKAQWLVSSSEYQEEGVVPIGEGYGNVGDLIYVREGFRCNGWATDVATIFYKACKHKSYTEMCEQYPVEGKKPLLVTPTWKPSIHMPRWASRLTLEITDVRIERLNDISNPDSLAEGIITEQFRPDDGFPVCDGYLAPGNKTNLAVPYRTDASIAFRDLWQSINGEDSWEANPWVWVVEFKVHKMNVDDFILDLT